MFFSDFVHLLWWWFVILIIGLTFLPLAQKIFSGFFDKGYIFSKTLGFAILSYIIFVLGVIHALPFSTLDSWIILILVFIFLRISWRSKEGKLVIHKNIFLLDKGRWKSAVFEEIIFFIALCIWAFIRGNNPDIHGLEKFMDYGFVNSILRSTYFPPRDIWFTPLPINYYYFGHLVTAVLTKLTVIPSNITFNLMIATLFAVSFTATFSIGGNLIYLNRKEVYTRLIVIGGLLSAFLVTLGGNLHIIYAFFSSYPNDSPVPPWQLTFQPLLFPNNYWYPNATRFIYHTIHEFPIYSWVVSDLHGHVLDIPFVLTTLAALLAIFHRRISIKQAIKINPNSSFWHRTLLLINNTFTNSFIKLTDLLLIGFSLAIMYMTNAWDGGIYLLLTILIFVHLQLNQELHRQKWLEKITGLQDIISPLVAIGALFFIFALPFSIFFDPSQLVHGIGIMCAPNFLTNIGHIGPFLFEPNHCQRSPWWQLLILYGFFAFFAISFLFLLIKNKSINNTPNKNEINNSTDKHQPGTDIFVLCLIILSVFLIAVPEFAYVKDIYPTYYRANTMFKLVFQAFIMLSLSSGYILYRFSQWFRFVVKTHHLKLSLILGVWLLTALVLCSLVALYPYLAINSYYNNLQTYHGLDGTKYLKNLYPTDYAAIQWLNRNIQGQPVILEAQGDSYTDYARVSSNTGLPTVLGWTVHEWLWRGSYNIPAPRITDVQTMYESTDISQVRQLLQKYHVRYIFVGDLERQKYPTMTESIFKQLGKVIYQDGNTRIYKLENGI